MDSNLSRTDLEHLASGGNQWASQELYKIYGTTHDAIVKYDPEQQRDAHGRFAAASSAADKATGKAERVLRDDPESRMSYGAQTDAAKAHAKAANLADKAGYKDLAAFHADWATHHAIEADNHGIGDTAMNAADKVRHLRDPVETYWNGYTVDGEATGDKPSIPSNKSIESSITKFSSDENRDSKGRWSSGGTSSLSSTQESRSKAAWDASSRADKSGSAADHAAAAEAHANAATGIVDDVHQEMAGFHSERADSANDANEQTSTAAHSAVSSISHWKSEHTDLTKAEDESLEDVLRHDKGHDDWHASHGDPPCKSEEDCKRMQAKYAEKALRSELQKEEVVNSKPNKRINPMIEKLKQDILAGGHAAEVAKELLEKFSDEEARDDHGRWTSGGGAGDSLSSRAGLILTNQGKMPIEDKLDAHNQLAIDHTLARNKAQESGNEDLAKLHNLAAKAHISAKDAWLNYSKNEGGLGARGKDWEKFLDIKNEQEAKAVQRTQTAAEKSRRASQGF